MTAQEIVELIATALAEHPETIDVYGGPMFGVIVVRTDQGTFRVRITEDDERPPRDLPPNDYAVIRTVGALLRWGGRRWRWDGRKWVEIR